MWTISNFFQASKFISIKMLFRKVNINHQSNFSTVAKSEKFVQKYCRITIVGASSRTGQSLALLLKQNPLISQIFMLDKSSTLGLAADIGHVDTKTEVLSFTDKDIISAIRNTDIIVMLGLDALHKESLLKNYLKVEGPRLISIATTCAMYAPKAIFIDCVHPVSVTLPLVSELYRKNHWYHPGRVLGSVALLQMRINTLLARFQNLDPTSVHVPLIGGPEEDTVIPLFSRATPAALPIDEARLLVNRFRGLDDGSDPIVEKASISHDFCPYSTAFSLNRLITTIALGILGDNAALSTAHVRSNFVESCRHIVATVKFGPAGIVHNYGVPRLTKLEMQLFESVAYELKKREHLAKEYLDASQDLLTTHVEERDELAEKIFFPPPKQAKQTCD